MKLFNSSKPLIFVAIALFLAFAVPLKAQDHPRNYGSAHNRVRAAVGVPFLGWNETLADYARSYATQRTDCRLILSGGPYGENLAWSNTDLSPEEAVSLWVSQRADYDYDTNTCRAGKTCRSYLQVVWRNSVSLGCAKVRCGDGASLIICEYDPSLVLGQRPF